MGLVPFSRKTTPATYAAPSGPSSKGRMPKRHTTPAAMRDSGPDSSKTMGVDPVDGSLRGHDRNYPRHKAERDS